MSVDCAFAISARGMFGGAFSIGSTNSRLRLFATLFDSPRMYSMVIIFWKIIQIFWSDFYYMAGLSPKPAQSPKNYHQFFFVFK